MRLYNIYGKLQNKNVSKYLIDWDEKSRSKIQFAVKQFIKPYWKGNIIYEEFPVYGSLMKVDFLNATKKIAIEVNGKQHSSFNKFFHNNSRATYLESIKRDYKKSEWLKSNGFALIEIEEKDIPKLSLEYVEKVCGISLL